MEGDSREFVADLRVREGKKPVLWTRPLSSIGALIILINKRYWLHEHHLVHEISKQLGRLGLGWVERY